MIRNSNENKCIDISEAKEEIKNNETDNNVKNFKIKLMKRKMKNTTPGERKASDGFSMQREEK